MKITLQRNPLLQAIQRCQSVVEKRHTIPILANVLLEADQESLRITANDMEVGIRSEVPAHVEQHGTLTVSARKLFDILRNLDADQDIHIDSEGEYVSLQAGSFKTRLVTMPADEFPALKEDDGHASIRLTGVHLAEMIAATGFAMSTDETRKYLTGTLFELKGQQMNLVATDGHRMALAEIPLAAEIPECQCIVPRKAVHEIRKLCEGIEEQVELVFGERQIRLNTGSDLLVSKIIDARFPVYQDVIPRDNPNIAIIPRQAFDQAITRTMIVANEVTHDLRLSLADDRLVINAHNNDQEQAEEHVPVDYKGRDLVIGFNGSYLRDVLNVLNSEWVRMELKDELSPILMHGEGDTRARYVIMPMRI